MKKEIIIITIFLIAICKISLGQINELNKSHGQYIYHNTIFAINNSFIIDADRKITGVNIQYPFKPEHILVTGAELKISITELNKQDSIYHSYSAFLYIRDDAAKDSGLFHLKNLQLMVTKNNKIINGWNDVLNYPSFLDSSIALNNNPNHFKKSYRVFNDSLNANDSIQIELRNKNNLQPLTSYSLKRIESPIAPFLAEMLHDSSTTETTAEFIQSAIAEKDKRMKSINTFYAGWPAPFGEGNNNERYFPSSRLAFYFRKPNANFPDSSLEYRLTGGDAIDTAWRKSGHMIIIPKLESNHHYVLSVRYINYPAIVWKKTFYVPPNWYQTNGFYLIAGAAAALLLTLFLFFLYRHRLKKEKERIAKLNLELRSIRSQLNPHFVFNALGSIQGLINSNEINKANQYLSEFSNLLRDSLNGSNRDFVPLENEIEMMKSYLNLEQLRFGFNYEINVDKNINASEIQIPTLLIQPLIENAVKHGISGMRENGKVFIDFFRKDKTMYIQIKDNGKGFNVNQVQNGFGLKLTCDRIHLLNQTHKKEFIAIDFNIEKEQGTHILLSFKDYFET